MEGAYAMLKQESIDLTPIMTPNSISQNPGSIDGSAIGSGKGEKEWTREGYEAVETI